MNTRVKLFLSKCITRLHFLVYGHRHWYNANGKLHRVDGPAFERADGTKAWFVNSLQHRLDGPAVEWANGDRQWWVNGQRHRIDGPSFEGVNGTKAWYVNGKCHRLDGPAIEWYGGDKEWWVDDKLLPLEEINQWIEENNLTVPFNEEAQLLFKLRWM